MSCSDSDTPGQPQTSSNAWQWVSIEGMKCRDGSDTGIGVRTNANSDKLAIYLEGGGDCFNKWSCDNNPNHVSQADFEGPEKIGQFGQSGIFASSNPQNPLKDWNFVFVPYCSGDLHAGNDTSVDVPDGGPTRQYMNGAGNIAAMLRHVTETFPQPKQVLLTGSSAGGFGASLNYDRVATAYRSVPVDLIDDAGPFLDTKHMPACLQERFATVPDMNKGMPSDCSNCQIGKNGDFADMYSFMGNKYPNAHLGLISGLHDETIRLFYSYGSDGCKNIGDPTPPQNYTEENYQEGLLLLRDNVLKPIPARNFGTYYTPAALHTYLLRDEFYSTTIQGVPLSTWVNNLVSGKPTQHVAP